jgi:Family of unknown function (DUF6496)
MPKVSRKSKKSVKRARMHEEMHKFRKGTLHSGSKTGPVVKDRSQAIAIGLNESGQSRRKVSKGRGKRKGKGHRKGTYSKR